MTDTITTTAPTADEAVAAATGSTVQATPTTGEAVARECVDVDPTTLILGDNVRAAAHLDRPVRPLTKCARCRRTMR